MVKKLSIIGKNRAKENKAALKKLEGYKTQEASLIKKSKKKAKSYI